MVTPLTYSATGLPAVWTSIRSSGVISGTFTDEAVNSTPYAVTVTADDGNGQTVSQTFNWIVNDASIQLQVLGVNATEGTDTGCGGRHVHGPQSGRADSNDYVATIDWGDGASDSGIVDGSAGSFTVYGDHTTPIRVITRPR